MKKDVVLMYEKMQPGIKNVVGDLKGDIPVIPPSFIAAAKTERNYSFLYGPLNFDLETTEPKKLWDAVKNAEKRLKESKDDFGGGAIESVFGAKDIEPVNIITGTKSYERSNTITGPLETDMMMVEKRANEGVKGDANTNIPYRNIPHMEGGNIGSIENIEPMPYYYLTQKETAEDGITVAKKIRNIFDIKRNELKKQLESLSDINITQSDYEAKQQEKESIQKETQVFSDILDAPDYRGQWGNTYTLDEKDLFAARFYKYYGRSSLIITLKDYVETGHSGKDSEKNT